MDMMELSFLKGFPFSAINNLSNFLAVLPVIVHVTVTREFPWCFAKFGAFATNCNSILLFSAITTKVTSYPCFLLFSLLTFMCIYKHWIVPRVI